MCRALAASLALAAVTAPRPTAALALRRAPRAALARPPPRRARRQDALDARRRLRGGATEDEDEDDDDYESDDDSATEEQEEEDDDAIFDEDVSDADFAGDTFKARTIKAWTATPPLTQAYVGASLSLTAGSFLLCGNQWPAFLNLDWPATLKRAQLWRPLTAFFYYGPFGLSYLLTIHFVWTYMGTLEKLQHAEPWDFAIMMAFGAGLLLAGVSLGGMNSRFLGHNLSCFLVYIWARTYEGQEVAVMEFFTIRAELLPWFFAAQTYLLEHEFPLHDLLGIAIGHLYTVARQRKRLGAPGFVRALFEARPALMAKYEGFADEFS